MSTCKEEYQRAVAKLTEASVPDAEVDAWYLFEYVTGYNRAAYFIKATEEMEPAKAEKLRELTEQRSRRIPLQYLTGTQEFMGLSFQVSPATLIPRQDTEILAEAAGKEVRGKRVLDLCTGTGCIIISLKKLYAPEYAVGTDISEEALETARKNAKALDAEVSFYSGDLFRALPDKERFDVIVSNPPYIPSAVIDTLMPEVREHEPLTALDGDADGLKFYRAIIENAGAYLNPGGKLFFEIGCEQAVEVSTLLSEHGFSDIRVIKDYAGLDRVVCGSLLETP